VIAGLGVATVATLLGCGDNIDPMEVPPDAADTGNGAKMCGANLCLDLAHPGNTTLATIGGTRAFVMPKRIVVIRADTARFVTLSRVCTHQGCTVVHNPATSSLNCPCHGSRFGLDGSVLNGPAFVPLFSHTTTFDDATQIITIVL
jgi:cytochrome b6-f complex iron-sulfur subunit